MSIGINLMTELLRKSAAVLGDKYDVEIIESTTTRSSTRLPALH